MPANYTAYEGPRTPRREGITLRGRVLLDGSSVPVTTTAQDKRRKTRWVCTRTGAGAYRLTLDDAYARFLGLRVGVLGAISTPATEGYLLREVTSETVSTTKQVNFVLARADGTAADPPASTTLMVEVDLDEVADND